MDPLSAQSLQSSLDLVSHVLEQRALASHQVNYFPILLLLCNFSHFKLANPSLITFVIITSDYLLNLGVGVNSQTDATDSDDPFLRPTTSDVFYDLLLNIFPDNIVAMCIQQVRFFFHKNAKLFLLIYAL